MAAEMKRLNLRKHQKQATKMNISKELKKCNSYLKPDTETDTELINLCLKKLISYRSELKTLDEEILMALQDDTEISSEIEKSSAIDDTLLEAIEKLTYRLEIRNTTSSRTNSADTTLSSDKCHGSVKLPKLQIAKFDGDTLKWQEFWDAFENSIHKNDELSPVDKFTYLKSFLSGDALHIADGYRLTAANYTAVVDTLSERFGNPQIAVFSHFEAMLAIPAAANYDLSQLQMIFDSCERHIRSLVALGLAEETFGQVFTPIVLSKLPKFVRIELHRKNGSTPWTLARLREFLKEEIHARDMSQRSFSSSPAAANAVSDQKSPKSESPANFSASHRGKSHRFSTSSSLVSPNRSVRCSYCGESHFSDQCTKYPDVSSRRRQLSGRCLSCLQSGHLVRECQNRRTCVHCNKPGHHRSLCEQKFGSRKTSDNPNVSLHADGTNVKVASFVPPKGTASLLSHGEQAILQTATTQVAGSKGSRSSRLLMDTGCSRSFITSRLCQQIGARYKGDELISIAGFADTRRKTVRYKIFEFDVILKDGARKTLTANATEQITCPVQKVAIDPKTHPIVSVIPLAEPLVPKSQMVEIDVLIGGDYYYDFVGPEQIKCSDGLLFLSSSLGYIAAGRLEAQSSANGGATSLLLTRSDPMTDSNFDVERFWKLEDIGIADHNCSTDDDAALQKFNSTIRFKDGRYEVKWPWKEAAPELADNYFLSRGRLKSLIKRLSTTPDAMQKYDLTIQEQVSKGIIEPVPPVPDGSVTYYIPHHCVVTPQKTTTKLRVVYDASSKSSPSDSSLNECIHRGPVILSDLTGMLIRFRIAPIAMVSDIEKAFLQVMLQTPDRDVTRFLWLRDLSKAPTDDNIVEYRFRRVPFGVNASPFLLAGTIAHHLNGIDTPTAKDIAANVYVDNVLAGRDSTGDAVEYYKEAKDIFRLASMNLREWFCNDPDLMSQIPETDRGSGESTKVLGLEWNVVKDELRCSVRQLDVDSISTKRHFMRAIASTFDPCGYFAPIVIKGKIILQEIWKHKYSWDDKLPLELLGEARRALTEIYQIPNFPIQRRYIGISPMDAQTHQLHCFADASAKAYSAVVFLRSECSKGTSVSLVFSKCRVSPLKALTIPKLELMAVVVGCRILQFVEEQLRLPVDRKFIWSDSQCTLHWILGKEVATVFVRNRVREIRKHNLVKFGYVPTEQNPADIPSRGVDSKILFDSALWWKGPPWLQLDDAKWPECCDDKFGPQLCLEKVVPKENVVVASTPPPKPVDCSDLLVDLERFSSLQRLMRVTCWIFRFVRSAKGDFPSSAFLSSVELDFAEQFWVKSIQQMAFRDICRPKSSSIVKQLNLFVDDQKIIRCGGRFQNSELSHDAKHPILLPSSNPFTRLVILDYHQRLMHAGVKHTLALIRQKFWIVRGRQEVKRSLSDCLICRRASGGPFRVPAEPPLPSFRVVPDVPFACTGIDYLGPLYIRKPNSVDDVQKVWICLFTCAAIRAVHLEVVTDLSTPQFILCLRRFVALFGAPKLIVSDNAKQFISANKVLSNVWKEHCQSRVPLSMWEGLCDSADVQNFSAQQGIQWKFITEMAPWMGGFYERMVGVTKQSLKKSLDRRLLTLTELQTVVSEITAIVNSRPLEYQEEEVGDCPLTPAHFLLRHRPGLPALLSTDPEYSDKERPSDRLISHWKRLQDILKSFWSMWRNNYLLGLREHSNYLRQRNVSSADPALGSVVIIKGDGPRSTWRMGRIVYHIFSDDGACRSVKLRLSNGKTINRPIKLLYPIEGSLNDVDGNSTPIGEAEGSTARHPPMTPRPQRASRPQRTAAKIARAKTQKIANDEDEHSESSSVEL